MIEEKIPVRGNHRLLKLCFIARKVPLTDRAGDDEMLATNDKLDEPNVRDNVHEYCQCTSTLWLDKNEFSFLLHCSDGRSNEMYECEKRRGTDNHHECLWTQKLLSTFIYAKCSHQKRLKHEPWNDHQCLGSLLE
jgi:hypothetical protein